MLNVLLKVISFNNTTRHTQPNSVSDRVTDVHLWDCSPNLRLEEQHLQPTLIPTRTNSISGPVMDPRHYNPDLTFDLRGLEEGRGWSVPNYNNNAPPLASDIEKEFTLKLDSALLSTSTTVVNLSDYELSLAEHNLLSLGKKFVMSPGEPNLGEIRSDEDTFHQACRRTHFFGKMTLNQNAPLTTPVGNQQHIRMSNPSLDMTAVRQRMKKHALFKTPSRWKPPPGPIPLESFIVINETELNRTIPRAPLRPNLSLEIKAAKKSLINNTQIVIKQADKGGAMVVWGREAYVREGHRQLADTMFYREEATDLTTSFNVLINNTLKDLEKVGEIDSEMLAMLLTEKARTSELYLLPKIHKGKTPCPGRPVVSGKGSPTEKISTFIDLFLGPLVPKIRSNIKDTTHVL